MKMIKYKELEIHNVAELEKANEGVILQRFPKSVRDNLGIPEYRRGRYRAEEGTGCEIRFKIKDGDTFILEMISNMSDGEIMIFCGELFHSKHTLRAGIKESILIEGNEKLKEVEEKALDIGRYSHKVWRVYISKGSRVQLCRLDTLGLELEKIEEGEKPLKTLLSYGSSITHGRSSTETQLSYVQQGARWSGLDVLCKGISGSCYVEKEIVDYLVEENWDIGTFELGINMIGYFTLEEFEKRFRYLVEKLIPLERKVIFITAYPCYIDYKKEKTSNEKKLESFREIMRRVYKEYEENINLYLLEGKEIMPSLEGMTTDLVHPSNEGHILMGMNLKKNLEKVL